MEKLYKRTKKVQGVGINDADYVTQKRVIQSNGRKKLVWICPFYDRWVGMIRRCYSPVFHKKYPSYKEHRVYQEWLTFSNFKAWMETQDWEGKDLDKDLLVEGNKVYSPETCVFISKELNRFMIMRGNDRGIWPVGVSKSGNLYAVKCSQGGASRSKALYFENPEQAHAKWQLLKVERAIHLQSQQTDSRVIAGLQRIIDKLQYDYENNLETFTL